MPKKRQGRLVLAWRKALTKRKEKSGEIVWDLAVGVLAALFAMRHAVFGVYPFSLALLFSASGRVLPVFVGGAVGCTFLGDAGVLYFALHIAALFYRAVASSRVRFCRGMDAETLFCEEPALRALGASLLGVFMALYELILFGLQRYTLLFAAGAVVLLPVLTLLFSFFTASGCTLRALLGKEAPGVSPYFGRHASFFLSIGFAVLLFVSAYSLTPYYFFGISLSGCATVAATLFVSRRFGAARGCVAGLLIGLAGEPLYLPAYGLLGLLSGLYGAIGMPLSLTAAVLSGGGYAAYVGGLSGFLAVMPEMAVTSLLLSVPLKLLPAPGGDSTPSASVVALKTPEKTEEESLACLSGALGAVAEELKTAAEREKRHLPRNTRGFARRQRRRSAAAVLRRGRAMKTRRYGKIFAPR